MRDKVRVISVAMEEGVGQAVERAEAGHPVRQEAQQALCVGCGNDLEHEGVLPGPRGRVSAVRAAYQAIVD